MHYVTQKAVETASEHGIDCELLDLRTLWPLDIETLLNSVRKTGRLVVVQEAPRQCGLASELIALINDKAIDSLQAPPVRVSSPDTAIPLARLEDYYLPDAGRILKAIQRVMSY
jgi:2-oxoisovalerate dehydrogenase E1 component beta subunit